MKYVSELVSVIILSIMEMNILTKRFSRQLSNPINLLR